MSFIQGASAAAISDLQAQLTALDQQKANASQLGGMSTRLNAAEAAMVTTLSNTVAGKADISLVPTMATSMPQGVADSGAAGSPSMKFSGEFHTHASKARKQRVAVSAATYTWTYPVAFASGVVPSCNALAETAAGVTDLINVQIDGVPTNTQCKFRITRVSPGLLSLLLGALSINPTPLSIYLHMTAFEP